MAGAPQLARQVQAKLGGTPDDGVSPGRQIRRGSSPAHGLEMGAEFSMERGALSAVRGALSPVPAGPAAAASVVADASKAPESRDRIVCMTVPRLVVEESS